jgi:hypothetical protein
MKNSDFSRSHMYLKGYSRNITYISEAKNVKYIDFSKNLFLEGNFQDYRLVE